MRVVFSVFMLTLLAACAIDQPQVQPDVSSTSDVAVTGKDTAAPLPAPTATVDNSTAETVAAVIAPAEPEAIAPARLDPDDLIGLEAGDLALLLGVPEYLRAEADIMIWQYRLETCIIDLVIEDQQALQVATSWHGRHRVSGGIYDHNTCSLELAERETR